MSKPGVRAPAGNSTDILIPSDPSTFKTPASMSVGSNPEMPTFYLNAFNGKLNLIDAYTWNRKRVSDDKRAR